MLRRYARLLVCAAGLGTLVALPLALNAAGRRIDIEPEGGTLNKSDEGPMQVYRSTACSGEKCVGTNDEIVASGEECGGFVKCTVNVDDAGTYYFWGRALWKDKCGDSFYVQLDDKDPSVFGNKAENVGKWGWFKGEPLELTAGSHTLWIKGREDGALLDKIVLHTSSRYNPQGKGG